MSERGSPAPEGTERPGATPPTATPTASAVSIALKLPPFWPADPELWFAQVEAQFACRRITSQRSKFDYVVSSLAPEFAGEVRDLLLRPPAEDPYDTLRTQLTKRTTASERRKLQQLFTTEELGDRKPTQLLRSMQQLLGDRPGMTDESFLRELFLQRLPPNVSMVLASTPDGTGLEQLADLADKVMEVARPTPGSNRMVAGVTTPPAPPAAPPSLAAEIEHLRQEVSRLQASVKQLARSRSSSHSTTRSSRRQPTPPPSDSTVSPNDSPLPLCWYHRTFGDQANRCRPPCARSNSQAGH